MREYLNKLQEERNRAWEEAKALLDTAEQEGRSLSAEEEAKWSAINDDLSAKDERIGEMLSAEERAKKADEARARFEALGGNVERDERSERAASKSSLDELQKLRNGEVRSFEIRPESRDLTKGTATAGGNLVATDFYSRLHQHMIENSAIRRTNATVLTTDEGRDLQVPKTTSFSTASLIGEGAAITESDPAFGQVTLQAFKYAILLQVSSELEQDQSINDFAGFLAQQAGRALGNKSGEHFVTGSGTSQPRGIVTAATVGVTGATGNSGVPTTNELLDLYYSVIEGYRTNGYWLMSDQTAKAIRKLKDSDGQYVWAPGLVAGEPSVLLGRPVVTDTNVADAATSAKSIAFGDFRSYYIRDVRGIRVERSDEFAFDTDLVTYRFILRTDGDLVDETGAVKLYQGGAS